MKIPLRQMVKARNPRMRVLRMRPIEPTQSMERDLAAIHLRMVRAWQVRISRVTDGYALELDRITSQVNDGMTRDADWLAVIIEAIVGEIDGEASFWQQLFTQWAYSAVQWHTRRIVANLKYASNVDLSDMLTEQDVSLTVEAIIQRNVALVADVSDQTRGRIADIVYRGLTNQTPTRDVAKQIREATGLARARSLRIAMDQTNKIVSALDRDRLRHLGFDGIEWRHSHKRNFRPEHKARDGKFFRWDSEVMRNDPPGYAPFCGCTSIGKMELAE